MDRSGKQCGLGMVQLSKLSEEERDLLRELVDTEAFAVLVNKMLPVLIEARAERVLTQTITTQADLLALAVTRAEFDGAKRLAMDVAKLKEQLLAPRKSSAPR